MLLTSSHTSGGVFSETKPLKKEMLFSPPDVSSAAHTALEMYREIVGVL